MHVLSIPMNHMIGEDDYLQKIIPVGLWEAKRVTGMTIARSQGWREDRAPSASDMVIICNTRGGPPQNVSGPKISLSME